MPVYFISTVGPVDKKFPAAFHQFGLLVGWEAVVSGPAFHLIFVHVHKEEGEKERARGKEGERENIPQLLMQVWITSTEGRV